ncbi:MAG: glpG protein [Treponema sp. GWB1_62_6]|nr:MAG: glpG protein [Treponema sp. GWA1_62_8]OHE68085.1 MAG: glpG protein [Treponema sp. GWB1_62_6]OHE68638.1 MAG: glpG protein [Treponema sp. GWC1_61_84]HCM26589.1 glpG protein [Treponema sp.]
MNIIRRPFRYAYGNAVLVLIALNLLAFLGQSAFPRLTAYMALNPVNVLRAGAFWQFVSYMFAHGSVSHLLVNMLGLFFFGMQVERHLGTKEFILYYLVTGTLAGVFSFLVYVVTGADHVYLLGASGALFAVQLAYATFFPNSVVYVWGILPVRAPVLVLGFTGVELFSSVFGISSGVAHLTHLAGFGFAWLYFMVRLGANPWYSLIGRR